MKTRLSSLLLTGLLFALSVSAHAQLVAEPTALIVTVPQEEELERTVTLTNTGSETVSFCLDFERPLQRKGKLRLSKRAAGAACGLFGEILYEVSDQTIAIGWDPSWLAMTPDGRLFAADFNSDRTHELTLDLEVVRSFDHPLVAELHPFPVTHGVTYNADTGTLWWMNIERCSPPPPGCIARALLLEGDLVGG